MAEPAIKGSAFTSVVDDIVKLVDEGRIDLAAVELTDKDRGLLDQLITPVSWMPIATYDRLLLVLCEVEGGADPIAYLRGRGARAAERLFGGSYESFKAEAGSWGPRVAQSFLGISRMLYNFTEWSLARSEDDLIEFAVTGAEALPDTALEAAHGFLDYFATTASGSAVEVSHTRTGSGEIRMQVRTR